MKQVPPPPPEQAEREIAALVETLHQTGARLDALTGGEMDSVVDRSGRLFLMRGVQEQLRRGEDSKQAAILSALPAHIALLDAAGVIVSVNEAWRRFGAENALHSPGHAVGVNYLEICDEARGNSAREAREVASGIRSVLHGSAKTFSLEYSCHSPEEQRFFLMTVTPLPGDPPKGAVVMHLNVTRERSSELGLRESEQRFQQMATSIEDVFFLQDPDGSHIYYVSPAYERIWGRSCESLYAEPLSWARAIHPDDQALALEQFKAGQGTGFNYEFRILRPDAGIRWIHVRGFPILDSAGTPYRTAGIASDITRQKGAEEKQRATAQLLDNIVENIPSAVQVKSVQDDLRIELWNKAAAAMYGVPSAEAIGKDVHALWPQADADRMRAADLDLVATRRMQDFPDRLAQTRLRGDIRVHMRKVALLDAEGKPTHLLIVADDRTEQLADQARLRESERRYRAMLANVQLASVMLDVNAHITYCNDYFLRLTGWTLADVIGKDWFELFMPAELGDMKPVFAALLNDLPEAWHRDNEIFTRSGERRMFRWNNTVLRSGSGAVVGTASIGADITEQKRAEDGLRESEARFRSLSALSSDWFWQQDEHHRFVRFSGGDNVEGWGPDQNMAVGLHRWDLGGIVPLSSSWKEHKALLDAHKPFRNFEYQRILGDGRLQYVEASGEPSFDSAGRFTGYQGVATEITVRKLAERDMDRQQSELRVLFDLMPAMIWFKDTENRILRVNRRVADAAGMTVAQIEGKASHEIYPEDAARFYADDLSVMKSGVPRLGYVETLQSAGGEQSWVQTDKVPYFDHLGKVMGVVVMAQDITERKRGEHDLQRFRTAMDSSGDGIVLVDRASMRYIDVNKTLCDMVGYTRDELIGMTPMELFGVERASLERDYDAIIADRSSSASVVEGHYRHKNGTTIPVETRRRAMQIDGGWIIVGSARDITGQRLSEHRIRRLNRVYAMLSEINTLIVRVRDRDELFREACRVAVDVGLFAKAWLGVVAPGSREFRMVAALGGDPDFFAKLADGLAIKFQAGEGLVARAVATQRPVVSNDAANDAEVLMREHAGQGSARSLAILPLIVSGNTVGVFALNADVPDFFDDEELKLLTQLADDIAHAIDHLGKAEKLERVSRVNAMLSGVNGAIARFRGRRELFHEVCRIAVESGGFPFAWMGVVNKSGTRLRLVASAGDGGSIVEIMKERLLLRDDAPDGHGVAATAFREMRAVAVNDVTTEALVVHKQAHAALGTKSIAALPLSVAGKAIGTFTLYASEVGFFDEDEMALLKEMAGNIEFALENMDKDASVRRLTRVYAVLSGVNSAIVRIRDRDALYREVCRIAVAEGEFTLSRVVAVAPDGKASVAATTEADPRLIESLLDAYNADPEHSEILIGPAIRGGTPIISNDVASDPRMPNRATLTKGGNYSVALLPVTVDGRVACVLFLRAKDADAFNEHELRLLRELVSNLSFALESMEKRKRVEYLAYHDDLTGLANRSLFHERLLECMAVARDHGRKIALVLIDIERFKSINDTFGRPAGDALLREFGERIAGSAEGRVRIARIDADHFAVIVPEMELESELANRIERRAADVLEPPFVIGTAELRISAKYGIAIFPADGADADTLFRNAEAALKKAKATGERFLYYTQDMNERIAERLTLENQLRQALDKSEFVLHYQPKISLMTGRLTSAEALIRWNNPRTGLVPPGQFIPILEETGLIYEVGRWALRQAIEDYLRWRSAGLPAVRIAVNVSPMQLRNRGFIAEIEKVIGVDAGAPAGLELEITESLIMEDVKRNIDSLQAIRAMNVTIAIDDFGTGFSSLSYLAKLPVDALKIDRSFVVDMTGSPQGLSLVSTIISLAHSLDLKVVAEGVETEEQSRLLKLLRCDEMQGFLFSKPVPAELFAASFLAPAAVPAPAT